MSGDPRTIWRHPNGEFVVVKGTDMEAAGAPTTRWRSFGYSHAHEAQQHDPSKYHDIVTAKIPGGSLRGAPGHYHNFWRNMPWRSYYYLVHKGIVPWEEMGGDSGARRDPRILATFDSWQGHVKATEPMDHKAKRWALIRCKDVPDLTYRSQMVGISGDFLSDRRTIERIFDDSSYPYTMGGSRWSEEPVIVKLDDLIALGWIVDGETTPSRKAIPDYPHRCLSCNDRVYIGLFEVIHERNGSSCSGRVY